jgi:hypothetical protein
MKKYFLLLLNVLLASITVNAQTEGTGYFLPKTELRFQLLIEKTTYTPGEYAVYSERFLKKQADKHSSTTYNIVGLKMYTTSIPDSEKNYVVPIDKKHTIFNVELDRSGILLAINTKPKSTVKPDSFTPYPKRKVLNPHDFMSEEILTAGSTAKMAELTAREIYDIRTSRNELTRGEAEYMPKDGDQLKIMLANLDRQENILLQMFQGVTMKDTVEHEIVFCPKGTAEDEDETEEKEVLFRFSKKFGLVDADDLAGAPYYIEIEDLKVIPELQTAVDGQKRSKKDLGIMVNMPGKIKATVLEGNRPLTSFELYAAQYGRLESLSSELFGKKMVSKLQLNPITGYVETLETEPIN